VAITFSAEIRGTTPNARVFLRALIDGEPTNPDDVLLVTDGGSSGLADTYTYTFVMQNVNPGSHTVQIQWALDPSTGGGAEVGDRTLTTYSFSRPQ
jgi:hypothetical protein